MGMLTRRRKIGKMVGLRRMRNTSLFINFQIDRQSMMKWYKVIVNVIENECSKVNLNYVEEYNFTSTTQVFFIKKKLNQKDNCLSVQPIGALKGLILLINHYIMETSLASFKLTLRKTIIISFHLFHYSLNFSFRTIVRISKNFPKVRISTCKKRYCQLLR